MKMLITVNEKCFNLIVGLTIKKKYSQMDLTLNVWTVLIHLGQVHQTCLYH